MNDTITKSGISEVLALIPDDLQNALIQIGERWGKDRWSIGDITNQICQTIRETGADVPIMSVYKTIAALLSHEVAFRTVEYWSAISAFYPQNIRDEYSGLPHSHFKFAMRLGDNFADALGASLDFFEANGRYPSVEYLEMQFPIASPGAPNPEYQDDSDELPEEESAAESNGVFPDMAKAAIASLRALQSAAEQFGLDENADKIRLMIDEIMGMY